MYLCNFKFNNILKKESRTLYLSLQLYLFSSYCKNPFSCFIMMRPDDWFHLAATCR